MQVLQQAGHPTKFRLDVPQPLSCNRAPPPAARCAAVCKALEGLRLPRPAGLLDLPPELLELVLSFLDMRSRWECQSTGPWAAALAAPFNLG